MDGTRDSHTEGIKSERERQIPCDITYMQSNIWHKWNFQQFWVYLVHGVSVCSSFIDLHAAVQVSQQYLLNRLPFSNVMLLPPLSKINWPKVSGFTSGFSFSSIGLSVCFGTSTTLSWWLWLCNIAWNLGELYLLLGFCSSALFWQFWVFCGPI